MKLTNAVAERIARRMTLDGFTCKEADVWNVYAPPRAPEQTHGEPVESRSKVKITRNAKGDSQWELSVVEGVTDVEMTRLRTLAVEQHKALLQELVSGAS